MTQWVVLVPVKSLRAAKSRLDLPAGARRSLTLAMLSDTLLSVCSAPGVVAVVVTDDAAAATVARDHGVAVASGEPAGGLNAAVSHGSSLARASFPDRRVAALTGDVPALRALELSGALEDAGRHEHSFVADAAGHGTTLLCGNTDLRPHFGEASAARHEAAGAAPLDREWPGLRLDVDTTADLAVALSLGVGPATESWLRQLAQPDAEQQLQLPSLHQLASWRQLPSAPPPLP